MTVFDVVQGTFSSEVHGRPVGQVIWAPANTSPDNVAIDAPEPFDNEVKVTMSSLLLQIAIGLDHAC